MLNPGGPAAGRTFHPGKGGSNSAAECLLPKQKVGGSNPLSRSIFDGSMPVYAGIVARTAPGSCLLKAGLRAGSGVFLRSLVGLLG